MPLRGWIFVSMRWSSKTFHLIDIPPPSINEREMVDAFRQKELPLFVAYYRRHLPKFEAVRRVLVEGRVRWGRG